MLHSSLESMRNWLILVLVYFFKALKIECRWFHQSLAGDGG